MTKTLTTRFAHYKAEKSPAAPAKDEVDPGLDAICKHFADIRSQKPSDAVTNYLQTFRQPKAMTLENFTHGVLEFMRVANFNADQRTAFYGDALFGLHYRESLADLWNSSCEHQVKSYVLSSVCPGPWEFGFNKGDPGCLVYKGNKPSSALDRLLLGPTVIDCGRFTQLAIWFGIRYILGDREFDLLFGKQALYLTIANYHAINEPSKAYAGNPLFEFMSRKDVSFRPLIGIGVCYVANTKMYPLKHPGGAGNGQNCILVNGKYNMFAPYAQQALNQELKPVETWLIDKFNAPQNQHDQDQLALYAELDTNEQHPILGISYGQLIAEAAIHAKMTIKELPRSATNYTVEFDFAVFCHWVAQQQAMRVQHKDHYFWALLDKTPELLLQQIPYENKHITAGKFKTDSPLQHDLREIAGVFCSSMSKDRSSLVLLSGDPGIGKTATAVICAKELSTRGKKVMWLSEVTQSAWAAQASDIQEYLQRLDRIHKLLAEQKPQVIFLDDNNMAGFSAYVLLAAIYTWYLQAPGRGLFITSNNELQITSAFGICVDGSYDYPPFAAYNDDRYTQQVQRFNLSGEYMRPIIDRSILQCTDDFRFAKLQSHPSGRSQGIILSKQSFAAIRAGLDCDLEFIPAFEYGLMDQINSLRCLIYNDRLSGDSETKLAAIMASLTPDQAKSLKTHKVYKSTMWESGVHKTTFDTDFVAVHQKSFNSTERIYIAVEIKVSRDQKYYDESIEQLKYVVNFAHDMGNKKVIVINSTELSDAELLTVIEQRIEDNERARTMSRLNTLLFAADFVQSEPAAVASRNSSGPRLVT